VAWDWVNGAFVRRWTFDSNVSGSQYTGQGDHSLSIGDVDDDGKQEVIYGAFVIDDNGAPLYNTTFGHGDALHVSDFDPNNPGLEIFNIQERDDDDDCYLYSALQKRVIWKNGATGGEGPGRGAAGNISSASAGAEMWVAGGQTTGGPWKTDGTSLGTAQPSAVNFLSYWDGDLERELCNGTTIDKYPTGRLLTASGCSSNNGSKSTPSLSGDIIGDWREELIVRTTDNTAIRIYTTTIASNSKIRTLLHDAHYRVALAWQNTAYNQPPHPSFFLGTGYALPAKPNITLVEGPTTGCTNPSKPTITGIASFCIGSSTILTSSVSSNMQWYKDGVAIANATNNTLSVAASGTYTVVASATVGSTCTSTSDATTITVNPSPATPVITGSLSICTGATTLLSSSTATGNQWLRDGVAITTNGTGQTYTASLAGSYTVKNTNTNTCSASSLASIVAQTTPSTWYQDTDLDGSGDLAIPLQSCSQPNGYVANSSDKCPTDANKILAGNCGCGKTEQSCIDCNGTTNGTATLDNCGRCTGGTSGKTACSNKKEAELACSFDGGAEATNIGYMGTGYINTPNAIGSQIEFALNASQTDNYILGIRYASTSNRPANLLNNGTQVGTMPFVSTTLFTTYATEEIHLNLAQGNNILSLESQTTAGLANIDLVYWYSPNLTEGDCQPTGLEDATLSGWYVHPNPFENTTTISKESAKANLKIYTLNGVLVHTAELNESLTIGNDLKAGMYQVIITENFKVSTLKLIKK
jgi:hypothetical protein